jgi:hypothetical protein
VSRALALIAAVAVSAVVAVTATQAASADAASPGRWHRVAHLDPAVPSAVKCPSASLCVAVDGASNAITTTNPYAGGQAWSVQQVDPGDALHDISCPSARLCIAVDQAGQVLTTTSPSAGPATWQTGLVDNSGLASVSCPSVSLCVAVGGSDVAFSNAPQLGAASWSVVRNVDQAADYECAKYSAGSPCSFGSFASVSCPSTRLCVAMDTEGDDAVSQDPGQSSGWPTFYGIESPNNGGPVVCPNTGVCLEQCIVGLGVSPLCPNGAYYTGDVIRFEPLGPSYLPDERISPGPLSNLWCAFGTCFAATQSGALYGTTTPRAVKAWWPRIRPPQTTGSETGAEITALTCPSPRSCLALTHAGDLLEGPPPPTRQQIQTSLNAALDAGRLTLQLRTLLHHRQYRERFTALAPGRLTIAWYLTATHGLIARGSRSFDQPDQRSALISPIRQRSIPLDRHRRSAFTVKATFAPNGAASIAAARRVLAK